MNPLIINLPRSIDRKATLDARLNPYFDNYQIIEGVDGSRLIENEYVSHLSELLNIPIHKLIPSYFMDRKNFQSYCRDERKILNKIGCYLSHLKCLKYIVDNNIPNALILEDDFKLNENINKQISPSTELIIYLGGWGRGDIPVSENIPLKDFELYGTFGYLIQNPENAQYILNLLYSGFNEGVGRIKLKRDFNPKVERLKIMSIDLFYKKFIHDRCVCQYPISVEPDDSYDSTIDKKNQTKRYGLKCISKLKLL